MLGLICFITTVGCYSYYFDGLFHRFGDCMNTSMFRKKSHSCQTFVPTVCHPPVMSISIKPASVDCSENDPDAVSDATNTLL